MVRPDDILSFWLDELDPKQHFNGGAELDAEITRRFGDAWADAQNGAFGLWLTYPNGTLAYVILNDQFPRNMFRDTAKAFSSDGLARAAAKMAIDRGWDKRTEERARSYFYLPLCHSENFSDQDRAVRLAMCRMDAGAKGGFLLHARVHREIIRQFGRFPYRNAALGRATTPQEQSFIDEGGYGKILRSFQAELEGAA